MRIRISYYHSNHVMFAELSGKIRIIATLHNLSLQKIPTNHKNLMNCIQKHPPRILFELFILLFSHSSTVSFFCSAFVCSTFMGFDITFRVAWVEMFDETSSWILCLECMQRFSRDKGLQEARSCSSSILSSDSLV